MNLISVNLSDMLFTREERVYKRQYLLQEYKKTTVCMTTNFVGEYKLLPFSTAAFLLFIRRIIALEKICYFDHIHDYMGDCAYFVIDDDAEQVKSRMCELEDTRNIGRLFDIDVFCSNGDKLSREQMRKCLICGDTAVACARNRTHSVESVRKVSCEILADFVTASIADYCYDALIAELDTTPKPGLVDRSNSGAHSDMDYNTFVASANSLRAYFDAVAHFIADSDLSDIDSTIAQLTSYGMKAEKDMLCATGGINTHKGAIYTLGLLCAGVVFAAHEGNGTAAAIAYAKKLANAKKHESSIQKSHGEKVLERFGIHGAEGEAKEGFPYVLFALSKLKEYEKLCKNTNEVYANTLLELMATMWDTNVLYRGGSNGNEFMQTRSKEILDTDIGERLQLLSEFDAEMIEKNLSPGGIADTLAAAIFLRRAEALLDYVLPI